jgi:hypothetical protein
MSKNSNVQNSCKSRRIKQKFPEVMHEFRDGRKKGKEEMRGKGEGKGRERREKG